MKKVLFVVPLVAILCACGGSKSPNKTNNQTTAPDKFSDLRATIATDLEENSALAASVAIYKDGKIVFSEAFGEKQKGSGELATPETLFQAGSTTKIFTSIATMQLVDQGLLNTHDNLVYLLPSLNVTSDQVNDWQDIKIYHLLSHQSGLPDTYFGSSADDRITEYMIETYPRNNRQMNPSGVFHNYSNPNWSYLGAVIEQLAGQDYDDYMQQNVFRALGMERTSIGRGSVVSDGDYALGFQRFDGEGMFLSDINQIPMTPNMEPAGSETWSTPSDLLKVVPFLLNGNPAVLSGVQRAKITRPHVSQDFAGLPLSYGYGMFIEDGIMYRDGWYPERVWQHNGNTNAFTSMFWILPDQGVAVSIMSSGDFNDFTETMLSAISAVASLPEIEEIPFGSIDPSQFEKHLGTYEAELFSVQVTQNGNRLEIEVPELDAGNIPYQTELVAIGDTTFVTAIDGEEVRFTFIPAFDGGESVYLRNREFVGIKHGY